MMTRLEDHSVTEPPPTAFQTATDATYDFSARDARPKQYLLFVALLLTVVVACFTSRANAMPISEASNKSIYGPRDGRHLPPTDLDRVEVGDLAPRFSLPSTSGELFDLEQAVGERRIILVFYRGHWCSVCARELAELSRQVHSREPSAAIYAISTDTLNESAELAELIAANGYPTQSLHFLEDERHRVIDRYGVLNRAAGDIAYRAVFVLDQQGVVVWRAVESGHHRDHESMLAELLKLLESPS